MRLLFHSYVGAVLVTQGMDTAQHWIGALVDPTYEPMDTDMDTAVYPKKVKTDALSPSPTMFPQFAPPAEPASIPPPPPSNPPPPLPNPIMPAQPTTAFLPMFNQTANQRRVFVEYPAQFSGPPHAGRWTVKCVGTFATTPSAVNVCVTGKKLAFQSTELRKAPALALANNLPRKKLRDKLGMPWDGHLVRFAADFLPTQSDSLFLGV